MNVTLDHLGKRFSSGGGLEPCDLTIHDGELFVLVGPSGAGKSTLLRLIAGLEEPDSGRLFFDDRDVTNFSPHSRELAFTPQRPALMPNLTIAQNLAFGMNLRGLPRAEIDSRVHETARRLHISSLLARRAQGLSAGEQQRVALGRGVIRQPRLWLLDEPLSGLDFGLRQELREELHLLQGRLNTTMIYVTHDPIEGMALGRRVGVLVNGRLLQVGSPDELHDHPNNLQVASCLGWPPINRFAGSVTVSPDGSAVFHSDDGTLRWKLPEEIAPGRRVVVARPEDVQCQHTEERDISLGRWEVIAVEQLGPASVLIARRGDRRLRVWQSTAQPKTMGEEVTLFIAPTKLMIFDEHIGARLC